MMESKVCAECGVRKDEKAYRLERTGENAGQRHPTCKACVRRIALAKRQENHDECWALENGSENSSAPTQKCLKDEFALAVLPVLLGRYLNSEEITQSYNFRFAVEDAYILAGMMLKQRGVESE
jgi:hypothetical protein